MAEGCRLASEVSNATLTRFLAAAEHATRLPAFLQTCFCAMTPVDFTRNPRSTSPGNNNTAKCVTSQFALPLRTSGTMRRINKSKARRESAQQTLMPLQIPGSTQEISPLRPGAKTNKPLRRKEQRRTMWKKCNYSNNSQHNKRKMLRLSRRCGRSFF